MLFLIIDGDDGKVSQLTLRMTSNSLSLFEVIGRRIYPHEVLWGRVQMLTHRFLIFAARVGSFSLLVLWRTLFLCLELEGFAPQTPHHPFVKGWTESLPRHRFLLWCPFLRSELFLLLLRVYCLIAFSKASPHSVHTLCSLSAILSLHSLQAIFPS